MDIAFQSQNKRIILMKLSRIPFIIGFILISTYSFGQWQIGIKVSPGITSSRSVILDNNYTLDKNNSGLRFLAGIILDYEFQENYYFSTGINFLPKKVAYQISGPTQNVNYNDVFNVQYLQLPITMKLYTNEIALDMRLYFQFGGLAEINIHDNIDQLNNTFVTKIALFDASIPVGAGVELKLGENTSVFGGLVYHRGLLNIASQNLIDKQYDLKMQFIGLEFGVKF